MELPFFYIDSYDPAQKTFTLGEDTSKHIVQVLRMQAGDQINLTDGKGNLLTCKITDAHKKHTEVNILNSRFTNPDSRTISIGISILKNTSRFEWFLEKATEIGINEIIPLICERTEKEKFRQDRMQQICISAMLQSQQCWLPVLHKPTNFSDVVKISHQQQKFIAHCMDETKRELADLVNKTLSSQIILIGPEGDFSKPEISEALEHGFSPVSLGSTRLRSETAGLVAAVQLAG